ncbi:MAG: hypothetical protein IAI50_18785 [Candidatus Eremiobacteraeota bacterium]|nr:hypothetical protein [Candidatus Eremiobacteraeota bacterium]
MTSRNITEVEVKLTLNNPDTTAPARDGAINSWKEINGRIVRVTSFATSKGTGKNKETTVQIITVAIKEDEA